MSHDRRLDQRASTELQARCLFGPNDAATVMVANLSASGCKVRLLKRHEIEPGQNVTLRIGSLLGLSAVVIWALGDEAGLEFKDPLHPSVVDHLVYGQNPSRHRHDATITDKFGRTLPKLEPQRRRAPGSTQRSC